MHLFESDAHLVRGRSFLLTAFNTGAATLKFGQLLSLYFKDPEAVYTSPAFALRMHLTQDLEQPNPGFLHWETNYGLALESDGLLCAGLAFMPFQNSLEIKQIQGVKGVHVLRLRWPQLLVHTLEELARPFSYDAISIEMARCNKYYELGPGEEAHKSRLHQRYDGTARSLRYRKDAASGVWVKKLRTG